MQHMTGTHVTWPPVMQLTNLGGRGVVNTFSRVFVCLTNSVIETTTEEFFF